MSIFWKNLSLNQLKQALEARKRELNDGTSAARKAEAKRAIRYLEKEILRRQRKCAPRAQKTI